MNPTSTGHTGRSHRRRSHTTRRRSVPGWATLTIGALIACAGLAAGAPESFAAEATPGQTPNGSTARVTWTFAGTPEIVFADGPRSPSVLGFDAPGYAPVSEFTTLYSKTKAIGYCLEPGVVGDANNYTLIYPNEYLTGGRGAPQWYAAQNFGKITWIIQNSYPALDAATFARISGIGTTNHYDLYNGTQAAIWHFTNGFTVTGGSPWTVDVFKWLVSRAKDVPVASQAAQLSVSPTSASKQVTGDSTLVGPISIRTAAAVKDLKVSATLPTGVTLTNAQGQPLAPTLSLDTEIYAKVSAGVPSGSISLNISGQGQTTVNGMVAVGTDVYGLGKAQARIMSGQPTPLPVSATATLSWIGSAAPVATSTTPAPVVPATSTAPRPTITTTLPAVTHTATAPAVTHTATAPAVTTTLPAATLTATRPAVTTTLPGATHTASRPAVTTTLPGATHTVAGATHTTTMPAITHTAPAVTHTITSAPPAQTAPQRPRPKDTSVDQSTSYTKRPRPNGTSVDQSASYQPRPQAQRPSLPKTGVDDQIWRFGTIGFGALVMGGGIVLLSRRRISTVRR